MWRRARQDDPPPTPTCSHTTNTRCLSRTKSRCEISDHTPIQQHPLRVAYKMRCIRQDAMHQTRCDAMHTRCAPSYTRSSPPLTLQHHLNRGLRGCGGKVQTRGMGHGVCAMGRLMLMRHAGMRLMGWAMGRSPSSRPAASRPSCAMHRCVSKRE